MVVTTSRRTVTALPWSDQTLMVTGVVGFCPWMTPSVAGMSSAPGPTGSTLRKTLFPKTCTSRPMELTSLGMDMSVVTTTMSSPGGGSCCVAQAMSAPMPATIAGKISFRTMIGETIRDRPGWTGRASALRVLPALGGVLVLEGLEALARDLDLDHAVPHDLRLAAEAGARRGRRRPCRGCRPRRPPARSSSSRPCSHVDVARGARADAAARAALRERAPSCAASRSDDPDRHLDLAEALEADDRHRVTGGACASSMPLACSTVLSPRRRRAGPRWRARWRGSSGGRRTPCVASSSASMRGVDARRRRSRARPPRAPRIASLDARAFAGFEQVGVRLERLARSPRGCAAPPRGSRRARRGAGPPRRGRAPRGASAPRSRRRGRSSASR